MAISYNKLWKLLVDKKMSKADLRKAAGIAPNTMTRLRRDEEVREVFLWAKRIMHILILRCLCGPALKHRLRQRSRLN